MDPNANLAEQRRLIHEAFHSNGGSGSIEGAEDKLLRLAELAEALDGWLSHGGFLPDAWAQR